MIASSQVEITTTSSPFGCGTRRDSCFQNAHQIDLTDLWVHQPQWEAAPAPQADNDNENDYRPSIDFRPPQPNKNWARARQMVFTPERPPPPVEPQPSNKWARAREIVFPAEVSNSGGVSSLVQKWRGFEAEAKVAAANKAVPGGEPPIALLTNDDDSIGDWESNRTVVSGRSSTCGGRDSDFTESERLRVADIIRRLTTEDGSFSPPRLRTSLDNQPDLHRCSLPPVAGSPRIRGRQAYIDLLTKMERDRRHELERLVGRKAVSQFSHRGRIQALLRIKFLRRGLGAIEGRFSNITASKPPLATHFRERLTTSSIEKTSDKAPDLPSEDEACNETKEEECEATASANDTSPEANTISIQENDEGLHSYKHEEIESVQKKEEQSIDDEVTQIVYDHTEEVSNDILQVAEGDAAYWVTDASHPEAVWEEEATSKDWICEISRPRSDWEDMRQARYQEMLDPFLDNEEIRSLLRSKSVSSFLSSDLRDKIDQVFMCRCQQTSKSKDEEKHEEETQVVASVDDTREGYGEFFDEFEEAESSVGQQYNESEYMDQTPSRQEETWPKNHSEYMDQSLSRQESWPPQNHSEYMDQTLSRQESWPQSQSFPVDHPTPPHQSSSMGLHSSYGAHPVIEVELIYDLRRHMEQLHEEMSELRKSIQCCMDMQVKLQGSNKKEDDTSSGRRNPTKKGNNMRGRCCICRKVQVDCLLYRCGHMCTCFKCAHDLQWSSGKCPVCRARIVDVVRTYSNY